MDRLTIANREDDRIAAQARALRDIRDHERLVRIVFGERAQHCGLRDRLANGFPNANRVMLRNTHHRERFLWLGQRVLDHHINNGVYLCLSAFHSACCRARDATAVDRDKACAVRAVVMNSLQNAAVFLPAILFVRP